MGRSVARLDAGGAVVARLSRRRPDARGERKAARWPSREEAATGPVLRRGTGRAEH